MSNYNPFTATEQSKVCTVLCVRNCMLQYNPGAWICICVVVRGLRPCAAWSLTLREEHRLEDVRWKRYLGLR
jgi:hypothetical protein